MPVETKKLYCVLIASPRDVSAERDIIREEIARWNSMHAIEMKMTLQPVGWETDATPDLRTDKLLSIATGRYLRHAHRCILDAPGYANTPS